MKKSDKKFEEKLSRDLEQYYDNMEVTELSEEKREELKNLVAQNKPKRKRITLWRKITAVASVVCLIALIVVIPTVIMLNKNNNRQNPPTIPPTTPIYYGKGEATKIRHTLEETQDIVNTYFPKYNFMFTDLTYVSSKGFYSPENNNLLSIQIILNEKELPLQIEINIIASKQFVFDDKNSYTTDAEFIQTDEYTLYKKTNSDPFNEFQSGYVIYKNHEIYINLDRINDELFNKFI